MYMIIKHKWWRWAKDENTVTGTLPYEVLCNGKVVILISTTVGTWRLKARYFLGAASNNPKSQSPVGKTKGAWGQGWERDGINESLMEFVGLGQLVMALQQWINARSKQHRRIAALCLLYTLYSGAYLQWFWYIYIFTSITQFSVI